MPQTAVTSVFEGTWPLVIGGERGRHTWRERERWPDATRVEGWERVAVEWRGTEGGGVGCRERGGVGRTDGGREKRRTVVQWTRSTEPLPKTLLLKRLWLPLRRAPSMEPPVPPPRCARAYSPSPHQITLPQRVGAARVFPHCSAFHTFRLGETSLQAGCIGHQQFRHAREKNM